MFSKNINLIFLFNTLRNNLTVHKVTHVNNWVYHVAHSLVCFNVINKGFINLKKVDRKRHQLFYRSIAGSKIIKCNVNTHIAKGNNICNGCIWRFSERIFCNFNFKIFSREVSFIKQLFDFMCKALTAHCFCWNIYRNNKIIFSVRKYRLKFLHCSCEYKIIKLHNKVWFFCSWNKEIRVYNRTVRLSAAD